MREELTSFANREDMQIKCAVAEANRRSNCICAFVRLYVLGRFANPNKAT
jgi:hypothetical protein